MNGSRLTAALLAIALPIVSSMQQTSAAPCVQSDALSDIPDIKLQLVADDIDSPVAITHAGDGSNRLFILEQYGVIRVIQDDKLLAEPFLDISQRVTSGGERGLLGIAFHPQFKRNGRFYLNYTTGDDTLTTIISEFTVKRQNSHPMQQSDANSERVLLRIEQPWGNHNGGQLAFGPDGYLYIATGDGGAANDPHNNGQNLNTLLGAILRIDVDQRSTDKAYGIPPDNPYINQKNAKPEIWAWGLRNPWRFSFDRLTGELYAADVGQDDVEEINIIEKSKNYGWRIMEGDICTPAVNPDCQRQGLTLPIYTYNHTIGRSITGGYVYRGNRYPELCGVYLYGDYVSQAIWGLRVKNGKVTRHKTLFKARSLFSLAIDYFSDDSLLISTFGEDEAGNIYVAAHQSGRIYRIGQN